MEGVVLARFFRGPFDGEALVLPTPEPWPRFVIPRFGTITVEVFYLLAGQLDEHLWAYLYEESDLIA